MREMCTFKIKALAICAFIVFGTLFTFAQSNSVKKIDEEMPAQWQYASMYSQTSPSEDAWWKSFGDPVLDSLITLGQDNNYDVLMAQRRIEIARQTLRQARSGYYPQLSFSGGWNRARTSGNTTNKTMEASTISYFDLGIDMAWELDVFGKITARAKESKAAFQASKAEYDATMVSVAAKIATSYFQLRSLQGQIEVMNHNIASQKRVLEITKAQFEAGLNSKLDVDQASTTYYSTQASIEQLKTQEAATLCSLAVLLGEFPSSMSAAVTTLSPLPDYRHIVAVGVPMELLRRRPDVIEAEYTLAQYAAAVGVAKKDFLPSLSLNGSIGTQSHDISNAFHKPSFTYTIAPTLSWTIFDGFSRRAGVESAKEQLKSAIDNYNLTLLSAVEEVEVAMATYVNDYERIEFIKKTLNAANESFTLSIDLYKQGLTNFINVTNSQISLLQYANEFVAAEAQALTDLVSLYQALGGGY